MTNQYNVKAQVEGESINEVVSKLMTASYAMDFELNELQVELATTESNVLFWEDVQDVFDDRDAPAVDNDPQETFHFPHVTQLVNGLQEKRRNGRR